MADNAEASAGRSGWPLCVALLLGLLLCIMIAVSPHWLIYDERYHMKSAAMLHRGYSLHRLLLTPLESAPGPLYPVLHALILPLTGLQAPAIRMLNPVLLAIAVAAIAGAIRSWGFGAPWGRAAMILAVPMVWATTGLALTEIPPMAMASLAVAAMAWAMRDPRPVVIWGGFLLAGAFAALAVLGRQTYLPAISAFVLVALSEPRLRGPALAGGGVAAALSAPLFLVWGGLVPPSQSKVGGGVAFDHGLLAFIYLAVVTAIVAPGFFAASWRRTIVAGAAAGIVIVLLGFRMSVASGVVGRLPGSLQPLVQAGISLVFAAIFAAFIAAALANAWQRRHDRLFLLVASQTALMTGTALGIVHLFSSRYVLAAFPFALLMMQPYFRPSAWAALRLAFGAALGAASLAAYFWSDPGPVPLPPPGMATAASAG